MRKGFFKFSLVMPRLGLFYPLPTSKGVKMKNVFSTKNIAGMAVFSAISFVVYLLEIPIFAGTPADFLKLDFSNVFVMLAGFMYGPIPAVIVVVVKELIHITVGTTGGVGEFANIIITLSYALLPSIVYHYKKGFKVVVITLVLACIIQSGVSLIVNRYINFPFFLEGVPFKVTDSTNAMFSTLWLYVLVFNVIKSIIISAVTILLYKRVSWLFKKINLQNSSN
jgi:ECF transporter S component (folate family)